MSGVPEIDRIGVRPNPTLALLQDFSNRLGWLERDSRQMANAVISEITVMNLDELPPDPEPPMRAWVISTDTHYVAGPGVWSIAP